MAFLSVKGIEEDLRSQHLLDEQTQIDISMLERLTNVRGRLEKPLSDQLVFVDYAHTPDALQNALQSLKQVATSNRITMSTYGRIWMWW